VAVEKAGSNKNLVVRERREQGQVVLALRPDKGAVAFLVVIPGGNLLFEPPPISAVDAWFRGDTDEQQIPFGNDNKKGRNTNTFSCGRRSS
jgi:hypothetical protein